MLGWEIFVERQSEVGTYEDKVKRPPLARWMAGLGGTDWLDDLVARGLATDLGGQGYPCRWTVSAGAMVTVLAHGLPTHKGPLVLGDDYVLPGGWTGDAQLDLARLRSLDPGEILSVQAWDQS